MDGFHGIHPSLLLLLGPVRGVQYNIASITKDILLDRFNKTCRLGSDKFPQNSKYNMWCENFNNNSLYDVFKHGTLSIGFIGLSEMIEILSGKKY